MNICKMMRKIEKHNIVSFDIFDTLLKRDVFKPTDVFELVQREYSSRTGKKSEFKKNRIAAEKIAREKSKYQEITLDEIYDEIDDPDKNSYKKLELEIESSVLHCNYELKPVYERAVALGKQIYIISDMYLPRSFLESILTREGYVNFEAVVLSADYRKTKRSGELYKKFLKDYDIKAGDVIHVGDSLYADFIGPRKVGIKTIHIPRQVKNTLYLSCPNDSTDFDRRTFFAFVNNRNKGCDSRGEQIGYEILGPILYAYCRWIHEQYDNVKSNSKRLWFAARDMYLFRETYSLLYEDDMVPDYMYISRRSLRPILTVSKDDITESGYVFPRGECTLTDIIQRMGYNLDDVEPGMDLEKRINPRNLSEYSEIKKALSTEKIMLKEKKLADAGIRYLVEHGYLDSDIVFSDVGWHGTTQFILQRILDTKKTGKKIFGLYLGCLDSTDERIGRENYLTFVFDEHHNSEFAKGILLFESLILAPHGSTLHYRDKDGVVEPVLGKPDNMSEFLKQVQAGAIRFVNEFKESIIGCSIKIDSRICTEAFCKLATEPQKEELDTIGQMDYDDFGIGKIASPKPLWFYILHLSRLHHDLKYSPWRIGFIYKLLKVRLPYAKIYSTLRRKQGKQT